MSDDVSSGDSLPAHLRALAEGHSAELRGELERALGRRMEELSVGRVGRGLKLSRLAVSGASKLIFGKAKGLLGREPGQVLTPQAGLQLASEMVETFAEMRGLAMKIGQMISYLDDSLPPEARKLLAVLQRDAPPMPLAQVEERLREELGRSTAEIFAEFDPVPLAAASIGQVHRARLVDGTEVAVKVQYPGIERAMAADLKNGRALWLMQQLVFTHTDLKAISEELEERFMDECDYRKEAAYQEAFRARLAGHPTIVIPEVHRELSTQRVLVTTLERGKTLYEWLATKPTLAERERATRTFYRFYLGSFYLDGLFNCDPHPGNTIFRDDGKIVFLDFGCVRRFPPERRDVWVEMPRAIDADVPDRIHRAALAVGFFKPDTEYDRAAFRTTMRGLYEGYLLDEPYDFSRHPPARAFRMLFNDNANMFKLNMPRDAVFLNRIIFGVISLMSAIGAPLNVHRLANAYFEMQDPDWPEDPYLVSKRPEAR